MADHDTITMVVLDQCNNWLSSNHGVCFYYGSKSAKEILSKKRSKKNTGKSAQNDKELQPFKKHQKARL